MQSSPACAEICLVRSGPYVQTASAGLGGDRASPYVPTGATPQPPMIYQSWVIITAVRRTEGRRGNAPVPTTARGGFHKTYKSALSRSAAALKKKQAHFGVKRQGFPCERSRGTRRGLSSALSCFAVKAGEVKAKERREGGAGFSLPASTPAYLTIGVGFVIMVLRFAY